MERKDEKFNGIYGIPGDTLRLIYKAEEVNIPVNNRKGYVMDNLRELYPNDFKQVEGMIEAMITECLQAQDKNSFSHGGHRTYVSNHILCCYCANCE